MADLKTQFKHLIQTRFAPVMQHFMENDYTHYDKEQFDLERFMAGFNERFDKHFSLLNDKLQNDLQNKVIEHLIKLFENCTLETESILYKEDTEYFHELRLMHKGKMVKCTYCYDYDLDLRSDKGIAFLLGHKLYNLVKNVVGCSYYNVEEILKELQIK